MANQKWTENSIPDLSGKIVIVTGANSGLGYESSRALAAKGATVIMACRNLTKGEKALQDIKKAHPEAKVELMELNLGSLNSVKHFADAFSQNYSQLDILLNNAGVMALPEGKTEDGFELQFGINHLGHFALTGHLLPNLEAAGDSRIVNVASKAADGGSINFDDLMGGESYSNFVAYSQSKLANLLFTQELQQRLSERNSSITAMAAHPGFSDTSLADKADINGFLRLIFPVFSLISQSAAKGALPQLYAATSEHSEGGKYYGPGGWNEISGPPKLAKVPEPAKNIEAQRKLWEVSEELTKVSYLS